MVSLSKDAFSIFSRIKAASFGKISHAGYPALAAISVFPANKTKADILMRNDRLITIDELELQWSVSHGSYQNIVQTIDNIVTVLL